MDKSQVDVWEFAMERTTKHGGGIVIADPSPLSMLSRKPAGGKNTTKDVAQSA